MHIGHYISGFGHFLLLFWAILGGLFESNEAPPLEMVNVSVISTTEYAAIIMPDAPPNAKILVDKILNPSLESEALPEQPTSEEAPVNMTNPYRIEKAAKPDKVPRPLNPLKTPMPQIEDKLPDLDTPSSDRLSMLKSPNRIEAPYKVDRIAPMAVAPSVPDIRIDDQTREAALPVEALNSPEIPEPEQISKPKETAEPEAAVEITSKVLKDLPMAPKISLRPKARPSLDSVAKTKENYKPADTQEQSINAALKTALENNANSGTAQKTQSGPPLTASEKDGLRLTVQKCWVVDVGSQAANVIVTVSISMNSDGTVIANSLRLKNSQGGSEGAVEAAFQAARRAILRCQKKSYDLPEEKYDHWREIEFTFDPRKMRIR